MSVAVELSPSEWKNAGYVGFNRHCMSVYRRAGHGWGGDGRDGWGLHIMGAMAEYAVSKLLGVHWEMYSAAPERTRGDVSGRQVRWTRHANGMLILHEPADGDRADDDYWLVRGGPPVFEVVGWLQGADGQVPEYWRTVRGQESRPAFFIPADKLHPATLARQPEIAQAP